MTKSTYKIFWGISLIAFLLFLPAFIVPFAFHNDGAYTTCKGNDLLSNFNENSMVFVMGRPVLAIYCGLQSWFINSFFDFSICRVLSFLFLTVFNFLLFRYLIRNCRLSVFWAGGISMICFFIPPDLLSVIWCNNQGPVVFNILLSAFAYFIFDNYGIAGALLAAVLFLTALLNYPASAFVFLVFPFARVLFADSSEEKNIHRIVIRDILFVIILMGIFRLVSMKFIIPWGLAHFHYGVTTGIYSSDLTNNISEKALLLVSMAGYALRGIWDFEGHWIGAGIVLGFIGMACYGGRLKGFKKRYLWLIILFLLANSPALLAKGCKDINDYGYRILAPAMLMGVLVIFKFFVSAEKNSSLVIKKLALFFIISSLSLGFWMEIGAVENSHQEYELAMGQLRQTDFSKIDSLLFIVNDRGQPLIKRKLPMEFSLLSVLTEHVNGYVIEYLHNKGYSVAHTRIITQGMKVFVPPGTKVIDLSSNALDKTKDPRNDDIVLQPYSSVASNLSIKVVESPDGKDAVMDFQTKYSDKLNLPFWFIDKDEKIASLEIIADKPIPISGYNCFVTAEDAKAQESIKWVLQGSNDGQHWANVDIRSNTMPLDNVLTMFYPINGQIAYNRYRFIWDKEACPVNAGIQLIKLRFFK